MTVAACDAEQPVWSLGAVLLSGPRSHPWSPSWRCRREDGSSVRLVACGMPQGLASEVRVSGVLGT